ncbi:hypothetical protein V8F33_013777 [Rhypophila sp. PSN 637]
MVPLVLFILFVLFNLPAVFGFCCLVLFPVRYHFPLDLGCVHFGGFQVLARGAGGASSITDMSPWLVVWCLE